MKYEGGLVELGVGQFHTEQPSALFGGDPVGLAWANGALLGPVRLGLEFVEGA